MSILYFSSRKQTQTKAHLENQPCVKRCSLSTALYALPPMQFFIRRVLFCSHPNNAFNIILDMKQANRLIGATSSIENKSRMNIHKPSSS